MALVVCSVFFFTVHVHVHPSSSLAVRVYTRTSVYVNRQPYLMVCLFFSPSSKKEKKNSCNCRVRNPTKRILYIYWMDLGCILIALMWCEFIMCATYEIHTTQRIERERARERSMESLTLEKSQPLCHPASQHSTAPLALSLRIE